MKRAVVVATLLALAGCTAALPGAGGAEQFGGDGVSAEVVAVVDGDTVEVSVDGDTETVRLVGVDTPETHVDTAPAEFEGVPDTEAGRACLRRHGERATEFARSELAGETVRLVADPETDRRGDYGRLLLYVLVDGASFNRRLVETGHARVFTSGFSRQPEYLDLEATAREADRGLWTCTDPEMARSGPPVARLSRA